MSDHVEVLRMILDGRISGRISEWPQIKPAIEHVLRSLRQVPDGELRAIADAIPDGTASFENTDHGRAAAAFYAAALNAFCSPAPTTIVEVDTFDDLVRKSQPVRTFDEIAAPTPAQAGAELPELPEPVGAMARNAWGPKPDYYTADQMHQYVLEDRARRGGSDGDGFRTCRCGSGPVHYEKDCDNE